MTGNYYNDLKYEYGITCKNTAKKYQNNNSAINRTIENKNFLIQCRKNKITPTFISNRTRGLMGDADKRQQEMKKLQN